MGMTAAGWAFLIFAWVLIIGLVGFCYRKIFSGNSTYDGD